MNIQGLQKLTLLDFPGRTACTVFTGGCNMRCPFCHNSPLVLDPNGADGFSEQDVFALLDKRKGVLDGVAVTGGEPLLQKDLARFLENVKKRGFLVKLDTNGSFPDRLRELLSNGLADYVAMDIKNAPEKYPLTAGVPGFDVSVIKKSIETLEASGVEHEYRTTVIKEFHTPDDIENAAKMIAGADQYFLQAFKDSGAILSGGCSAHSEETMRLMAQKASQFVKRCELRGI